MPRTPRAGGALTVSRAAARRFLLLALGLEAPHRNVAEALDHHGFVQLDPINVCGRMHDLILRNRVVGYREGDVLRRLHGRSMEDGPPLAPAQRTAFEHYLPGGTLAAVPLASWPYLAAAMEARSRRPGGYGGRLSAAEERLARRILAEMAERGPLTPDDIDHDGRATTGWGTQGRMAKTVLEKLFFHGRVLITARRAFRRVYDLPERVLPAEVLFSPRPSPAEEVRFRVLSRLRQRRLAVVSKDDLSLLDGAVEHVHIEGCPPCCCLREDVPRLLSAEEAPPAQAVHLLAPLDPLIYDRRLTSALWGFDYTWEVYTPPARRVRGYYALPVLAGERLVGHVEPRAERGRGRLLVVSRRVAPGIAWRPALGELARFLGLMA
ncbi:MAG TPA: crosslink repair DNA glycosylase YcaQ family protein [Anaeromyxobacter sp.]|nr:crosslink repair DNA glycosylase YcaQ family protein [Anaeromyxobacter sp.]